MIRVCATGGFAHQVLIAVTLQSWTMMDRLMIVALALIQI